MITNSMQKSAIANAIKKIENLTHVKQKVYSIRVLQFDEKQ